MGEEIKSVICFLHLKKTKDYDEALAQSEKFTQDLKDLLKSKNIVAPDDESGVGVYNSVKDANNFMI